MNTIAARAWQAAGANSTSSVVRERRAVFFTSVVALTLMLCFAFAVILASAGQHPLWIALQLVPFAVLSAMLVLGFCQGVVGTFLLAKGGDRLRISRTVDWSDHDFRLQGRTAIAIPIYNEDVREVFQRIRVMRRSLDATGHGRAFDFFVLSDSSDPDKWIEEEIAWASLQKGTSVNGNRVFYRRRRPINNKSGNIADFCRRWGRKYRHMIVLDADSFMTGETMVALARLMEANPKAGIIQTVPRLIGSKSFFARAIQFASRLYSPALAAGGNYWQQGDANFWGHNAIIRLAPFIQHCALPKLPGTGAFGGRILSHDFVEAALMRRAGWEVWCANDLEGSYEGAPQTMLDYLARDRRWCQGNLQHVRLLLGKGIAPLSKIHMLTGVLAYASSPLLVFFIAASLAGGIFSGNAAAGALVLFGITMALIFGMKIMGAFSLLASPSQARGYGGVVRALTSMVCETVFSCLIAPVFLWYHTKFVLFTLAGKRITWTSQDRGGSGTSWEAALHEHETQTLAGVALALGLGAFAPGLFWWFAPLLAGMIFSIPISVLSSRVIGSGDAASSLFFIPEEVTPEYVLKNLHAHINRDEEGNQQRAGSMDAALVRAVVDPYTNAVHLHLLRAKKRRNPALDSLCRRLYRLGPESLTTAWKRALLSDRESVAWLHRQIWSTPAGRLPNWCRIARRQAAGAGLA